MVFLKRLVTRGRHMGKINCNCLFGSSLQNQRNLRAVRRAVKTPQIHYKTEGRRGRTSATAKKNFKTNASHVLV